EKEGIAKVREVACKKAQEILDLRKKLADAEAEKVTRVVNKLKDMDKIHGQQDFIRKLQADLAEAKKELFDSNIEWAIETNKMLDENKRLSGGLGLMQINSKLVVNPNLCQVCGVYIKGMEHSCQ
ncbi:hypothetical protein LCGC14_3098330, partial [marine sediment metagenome]